MMKTKNIRNLIVVIFLVLPINASVASAASDVVCISFTKLILEAMLTKDQGAMDFFKEQYAKDGCNITEAQINSDPELVYLYRQVKNQSGK